MATLGMASRDSAKQGDVNLCLLEQSGSFEYAGRNSIQLVDNENGAISQG